MVCLLGLDFVQGTTRE